MRGLSPGLYTDKEWHDHLNPGSLESPASLNSRDVRTAHAPQPDTVLSGDLINAVEPDGDGSSLGSRSDCDLCPTAARDYSGSMTADEARLLIFNRDRNTSWDEKRFTRSEAFNGRDIMVWGHSPFQVSGLRPVP